MIHYFSKTFCLFFICILTTSLSAQSGSYQPQKISPAALKSDFLSLRDTLQKIHPGMYRYNGKASLDKTLDSCYNAISDSMSLKDFYLLVSFATAAIKDGHTNCNLPRDMTLSYISSVNVFPAMVLFLNNRAFIFCCKQNNELAGAELLTINNIPLSEIVKKLFNYIPSDGSILSRKNWEMAEKFHLLYSFIYGPQSSFDITYKTKANEIKSARLQADLIKDIICARPFPKPARYLQLSYDEYNTAILTVRTFSNDILEKNGEYFSRFLDSAFTEIKEKKISRLLIDIRGNQGGNDGNGALLYSYLTQKSFMYYARQETTNEIFSEKGHPNLALQYPQKNNFDGKAYFLIDGRSFSASAEFAAIARSNNRGLFIGEETGGGYYGNTSGDEAIVTLPNSKITCRIPKVKYTMAVREIPQKDRGVIPDLPVYPVIDDLIENKDRQLEFALTFIRQDK